MLRNGSLSPLMPASALRATVLESPSPRILGEKHRVGTLEIPEHEHPDFCLHLQTSGLARLHWWSDGKHGIEVHRSGSLILLPPGTRDRLRWEGTSERFVLSLDVEYLKSVAEAKGLNGLPEFHTRWHLQDATLQRCLARTCEEFAGGWNLGRLSADLYSLRLAELLIDKHTFTLGAVQYVRVGLDDRRLRLAMEFLTDNMCRDVGLTDVAHAIGMSPFHFARMFRLQTGSTPFGYLTEQRIRRAKQLLRDTRLSVQIIAQHVGFTNVSGFSRAFRLHVKVSPRQFRQGCVPPK